MNNMEDILKIIETALSNLDEENLQKLKIWGKQTDFTTKWNSIIYRIIKRYEKNIDKTF